MTYFINKERNKINLNPSNFSTPQKNRQITHNKYITQQKQKTVLSHYFP